VFRDRFREIFPETAQENRYHIQAAFIFNKMKVGDIVVITKGNHIIDAIGKVIGEYYFNDQNPTDFCHFRKVEWIATGMNSSPEKFLDKQISQQSIYEFYDADVKKNVFNQLTEVDVTEEKPYVLVIDEINRGNISAIFGELITLIEFDKRIGMANELRIVLPYSKERFGVPSNLYILGTMNTADRSVEALDTALRRRFSFVEMLPKPELLKDKEIEGVNLKTLLEIINERIEVLVDRDHTIGHAFFINDTTIEDLRNTFANKIIPLLQEYFYGDYSKMELVIGSAFFDKKEVSKVKFAVKSDDFEAEGQVYHIKNISDTSVMSDKDFITALEILIKGEA
jgi:5-methylcytosine-specific restriction protein B